MLNSKPSTMVPAGILMACVLALAIVFYIPSTIIPVSWDFRNNLWGPTYLLIHRASPYNIHVIFRDSNAIWLPMIIGLLLPMGLLPMQWASNLWLLLNLSALFTTVVLSTNIPRRSLPWIVVTTFALAIFPSSMSVFRFGQISLIVCLALTALSKYRQRLPPLAAGGLLAVSLTKPQLLILYLPAFLALCLREQGARRAVQVVLSTVIWSVALCIPLFLLYPNWIPDFQHNLAINQPWFYPSLYSFLSSTIASPTLPVALAALYVLVGLGVMALVLSRVEGYEALLWALALTPLFSPVIWSWDFVLILPLLVFSASRARSRVTEWVLYLGYATCTLAFIVMRIQGVFNDQFAVWVPPLLNAILLIARSLPRRDPPSALSLIP